MSGGGAVAVNVDGATVALPPGATVLDACREAGSAVPTLCYGPTLTPANACRVCVVEVEGARTLVPACSRPVAEGMVVATATERVQRARRLIFELLASASQLDRAHSELASWVEASGADGERFGPAADEAPRVAPSAGHLRPHDGIAAGVAEPVKIEDDLYVRDYSRCILCYRCVEACGVDHQNTYAIAVAGRGFDAHISTEFDVALPESACVYCGNCIGVCPTGALVGKVEYDMREAGSWDPDRQSVTRTVCTYCGVGCNLDVRTQDGRIVDVTPPFDHDVTAGNLCIKGRFGWQFVHSDP